MKNLLDNDWQDLLTEEFDKEYYQNLRLFLVNEYKNNTIYPNMQDIFNALKFTAYKDVKVVINLIYVTDELHIIISVIYLSYTYSILFNLFFIFFIFLSFFIFSL